MTEQASPPVNPYRQRHGKITAAVATWMNDKPKDQTVTEDAHDLVSCLDDQGLQILPRCPSYARWRVIVDGAAAPAPFNPKRTSGPLDADEAAEAFLQAAVRAEDGDSSTEITVRPATDRELVSQVMGDTTLDSPAVVVEPQTWAVLADEQDPDVRLLSATDGTNTVVLRLDSDTLSMLGQALSDESEEATHG